MHGVGLKVLWLPGQESKSKVELFGYTGYILGLYRLQS